MLGSIILASAAVPLLSSFAGPLAVAQARKPRPVEETISDTTETEKLGRSNTTGGTAARPRRPARTDSGLSDPEDARPGRVAGLRPKDGTAGARRRVPRPEGAPTKGAPQRPSMLVVAGVAESRLSSSSLPELRIPKEAAVPTPPATAGLQKPAEARRHHSHGPGRPLYPSVLSRNQRIRMLRANYFRCETQLLSALEDISNRLVAVPKPARLSALRAELALIDRDFPAEVDVPVICPASLEDGVAGKSQHHRIVRINPAEATSLNSAERVPYLIMVEVLREDFDFNPDTEDNERILNQLLADKGSTKRRLFDLTDAARLIEEVEAKPADPTGDSVFEPASGDLGSAMLIKDPDEIERPRSSKASPKVFPINGTAQAGRSSSGAYTTSSTTALSTPRTSDSRAASPGPRKMTLPMRNNQGADQPDFSALATHMRTAAQMLAQLETSGSKRPKAEIAAIKANIIASMQNLEEQSFQDETAAPTFDTIMANAAAENGTVTAIPEEDIEDELTVTDPASSSGKGASRMENDQMTGGVQRKGDRDDPSAATFGEEWAAKKERIRKSSPYGWMKNWDLVSVIVKTGADLRQEAFACQLIQVCTKIWKERNVPVWTRRMKILVTGESSGLIETITNGVSLHSIKRSLTLASIAAGTNPKKRIATLKDHFVRAFGEPDSDAYIAGAEAFSRSLAAYSVICYVLQIKDRHNGNILIDNLGHMIHIDFGFLLSNSPGGMGFEAAPFKLTQEYIDVLGGLESDTFKAFKKMCKQAFQALRKEAERIIMLVDLMGKESKMPCYAVGVGTVVNALRARFVLHLSKEEAEGYVDELVAKSAGSYYTRL